MGLLESQKSRIFENDGDVYHSAFPITPNDDNPLSLNGDDVVVRAIYVGDETADTSGDITGKVLTANGAPATVTFREIQQGTLLPVAFIEIHATGTDFVASDLIGLL